MRLEHGRCAHSRRRRVKNQRPSESGRRASLRITHARNDRLTDDAGDDDGREGCRCIGDVRTDR